jgi:hypothetical protein
MKMNLPARQKFVDAALAVFGKDKKTINRAEIKTVVTKKKMDYPNWITNDLGFRLGRGLYTLKTLPDANKVIVKPAKVQKEKRNKRVNAPVLTPLVINSIPTVDSLAPQMAKGEIVANVNEPETVNLVPEPADGYVPFGYFTDVRDIVKAGIFYPAYVTGLSGNGKTMMIEQVHADLGREMIRVNITVETDEDDLIGGFRLVNGATVWQNGPVVIAMLRGCTLLLDEVDLGSNKLMCLQPVLEGKGIFLKKINKMIHPAKGFNIFATANTKGKGSDDGRFIGTNVLNEAFLERFSITLEQEYPNSKVETKILNNVMHSVGVEDSEFVKMLVMWAEIVRETYKNGGIGEIISTRRLVHICQAYGIFGKDRKKSLTMCLNRFDDDTKNSMMQLYEKVDETINPIPQPNKEDNDFSTMNPDDTPF